MVTFFQSLERMVDPTTALAQAHDMVRPGDFIAIETGDRQSLVARALGRHWPQVSPPTVAWMWSRKGFRLALEAAGLEVQVIEQ